MKNQVSRFKAREQGFLLVFETIFNKEPLEDIIEAAEESRELEFSNYAKVLAFDVLKNEEEIDGLISSHLKKGWTIRRISKPSLAILRVAICEMKYEDVPVSIAINEAVDLAKKYTINESKFINGVLGAISRE